MSWMEPDWRHEEACLALVYRVLSFLNNLLMELICRQIIIPLHITASSHFRQTFLVGKCITLFWSSRRYIIYMIYTLPKHSLWENEGGQCRVSRSNFWQCRVSTWKLGCRVSTLHSVALWLICPIAGGSTRMADPDFFRPSGVSGWFFNVECRAIFSLSVGCRIGKLDNVGCWKNPLHGYYYSILELVHPWAQSVSKHRVGVQCFQNAASIRS